MRLAMRLAMRPAARPAHGTPRYATRNGIAELPTPRPAHRNATPHRQRPAAPPQRHNAAISHDDPTPFDTHGGTSMKRATTRQDKTAREHKLTKTAQQDNADTRRPTTRNAETRRDEKRNEKRNANADTRTPTHETRTGRQHETIRRDEKRDANTNETLPRDEERDETKRHRPARPRRETKRNDMRCHHRHAHGTPLSSPDKPPRRADKNGASIASPSQPDNRHEKSERTTQSTHFAIKRPSRPAQRLAKRHAPRPAQTPRHAIFRTAPPINDTTCLHIAPTAPKHEREINARPPQTS